MPPEFPNGAITKYSIEYNGVTIDEFGNNVGDKMIGTVDGLSPNTLYAFEVKAHTRMGPGPSVYIAGKTRKLICKYIHSCVVHYAVNYIESA